MEAEARTEIERLITCQVIESFGLDISSFALDMTTFAIYIDSANTVAPKRSGTGQAETARSVAGRARAGSRPRWRHPGALTCLGRRPVQHHFAKPYHSAP